MVVASNCATHTSLIQLAILCVLPLASVDSKSVSVSPIIDTRQGKVQGLVQVFSKYDQEVSVARFTGIPFAAPPVGSLRYMPPVSTPPWREVRNVSTFRPVCPQVFPRQLVNQSFASQGKTKEFESLRQRLESQSEDCLYLNVFAPNQGVKGRLPVVVFIHGEDSYEWGSGNLYDGTAMAAFANVIVVTMNYRLGVLGFLNPNIDAESRSPGNLGILDQIATLHWVQENIRGFGGDPKNVTLLGHGKGSSCVHFLMTSEALPQGTLFKKVILLSGSAIAPFSLSKNASMITKELGQSLNCSISSPSLLLQCLRTIPLYHLMTAGTSLGERPSLFHEMPIWGPSLDGVVVHTFQHRINEYLERMSKYDLMIGLGSADALVLLNERQIQYGIDSKERNRILSDFVTATYPVHQREIFSVIMTHYTNWESPSLRPIELKDELVAALNDAMFGAPLTETGDYHSSIHESSWFYVFDYQSRGSYYKQRQGSVFGEQLKYIFGEPFLDRNAFTDGERKLSEIMMNYIGNFVSYGNPNEQTGSDPTRENALEWPKYDPNGKKYLHIGRAESCNDDYQMDLILCYRISGSKLRQRSNYRAAKIALWINLVPDLLNAAAASRQYEENEMSHFTDFMTNYHAYFEILRFIPNLKLVTQWGSTPSSSEVLWPSTMNKNPVRGDNDTLSLGNHFSEGVNATIIVQSKSLSNYSTALSVTIAIGCSLLVLNVLIFAAVYYQRDRYPDQCESKGDGSLRHSSSRESLMPSSISHTIEKQRRPSTVDNISTSSNHSLTDMAKRDHPPPPITSILRKSTLKVATLPPPQFADHPPNPPMATSMQTLPRNKMGIGHSPRHLYDDPSPPMFYGKVPNNGSVTLPLKSSLKKKVMEDFPPPWSGADMDQPNLDELRV
eukprot:maker-scaffold276_size226481-snap-gene-1.31 protein:Tk04712 transcript:maker-scaffold276_size226481-snap-gene-1.31-mRNA-1 annotation:"hypothetical protein DAPPUDRAFT_10046"